MSRPFALGSAYAKDCEWQIPSPKIPEIYRALATSSFATAYGSTNPQEDFADAFAELVLAKYYGVARTVEIEPADGAAFVVDSCWGQPRCREKERVIEELLSGAAAH